MKIAFIGSRGIPHSYASAEQLVRYLGAHLVSKGHEFTVYCHANEFKTDRDPYYRGIRRVFIPTVRHKIFGQAVHAALSSIHAVFQDYDLIHYQCLNNSFQSIIPFIFGKRIVTNVDGQIWDDPKWPNHFRQVFFRSAARAAILVSKEIVTDAIGIRDIYLNDYNKKSAVIEYGAEIVNSKNPSVVEKYGLKPKQYYFVAARLAMSNSTDVIVEAFKRSRSGRVLAIAGSSSFGGEWLTRLKSGAGSNVKFLGNVSDQDDLNELYCNAYAYLHGASLGGTNSALLRPLGSGLPCLVLDTVYNREVIQMNDGTSCGLVWQRTPESLAGFINLIDADEFLAGRLGGLGQKRIQEAFTWDRICRQYEQFYQGVLEGQNIDSLSERVAGC